MIDKLPRESLAGHLPASDPLSPRQALKNFPPLTSAIIDYEPSALWEQDTASLPEPLQRLRRQTRAFAEKELRPRALHGDLYPHDEQVEAIVLRRAAEEGVISNHIPKPFGSAGTELMDHPPQLAAVVKVEELCAACGGWGLVLAAHALGTMPLVLAGDKKALKRFLRPAQERMSQGEPYIFAFAITEPSAGSDVEEGVGATQYKPRTVARRAADGWVLNGRKVYISGGDIADAVTVFAAIEDEGMDSWTCFLVEKDMAGCRVVHNELKMGQRASGATELELRDVLVPDDHVIGGLRNGWALNRATLNASRMPVAAIALGIARGAMEAAVDFVCCHQTAGRALIDYQEVQLAVAQMIMDTSAMRSMIWQYASRPVPTQANASMCKVACSDSAVRVCEQAMALLSNHGVLHGNSVEKGFRDARLTQIYEGTNEINRLLIIEDLQEQFLRRLAGEAARSL
jgi:alkylation response protein AidB-like acyl-CoA dehydrogenase